MVALLFESVNHRLISDASTVLWAVLLWFHHSFVVIAQVGKRAFVAARVLKHAHALSMPQQAFVKIVDGAGILREERLQKSMGGIGCHFLAN